LAERFRGSEFGTGGRPERGRLSERALVTSGQERPGGELGSIRLAREKKLTIEGKKRGETYINSGAGKRNKRQPKHPCGRGETSRKKRGLRYDETANFGLCKKKITATLTEAAKKRTENST